ncbi:uncharacterized protein LOC132613418 [Lycium barbarum]|uniref:uncharacterized protein LOC132613418 n=1 Tax=Lycium barbarum TaxID=112863 RepID=UPI00293ED77F|nr:uncharacterized protein LOC132613418 [Lycium barbarum]
MDVNNRRALARSRARARAGAKRAESTATAGVFAGAPAGVAAGHAAGAIEYVDWRTQLAPDSRQRIINKIMETLSRHLPVYEQEGLQELEMIAVRFEETIYANAISQQDYLRKISLKMLTLEEKPQNPMTNSLHPYPANSGWNGHGPVMTMGATTYETTSGPEVSDKEQSTEEEGGDVSKEDSVEEVVVTKEQNYVVGHKENVKVGESEISCGLSSGAKLDERLSQVEERLEKMEAHSEKVETLLVDINEKLNHLVQMQDVEVSRDIKRPAKYMSSSWTGNGRQKRKHRVAEMIRQSCKHRRLGKGAIGK